MRISDWSSDVCSSDLPGSVALPFDVLEAVAAFKKAAWLFGETDRCLVQSLATCALLRRQGVPCRFAIGVRSRPRSKEHTSELQSLMRSSYPLFSLKKNNYTYKRLTVNTY